MNFAFIPLVVVLLWAVKSLLHAFTSPYRKVPGPWYTLFSRFPISYLAITGRRAFFIHDLHKRYGSVVRIAPNEISCTSAPDFKIVHGHGKGWFKTSYYVRLSDLEPDANFHNEFSLGDPTLHGARRRLLARPFSKSEIRKNWEEEVRQFAEVAMAKMAEDAAKDPSGEVDVHKWWALFASDASSRMAFGENFGLLERGEKNEYFKNLETINFASAAAAEFPVIKRIGTMIPVKKSRAFWTARTINKVYARQAVAKSRTACTKGSVFTSILGHADERDSRVSEPWLVNEASGLIVAGSDTTANTMTYLIWNVLSRPDLQEALVKELTDNAPQDGFSDQVLETLPILNATIKETMRLYPAVPSSLPRSPPRGGALLAEGSIYVPDGAVVSTQAWSIHRDPQIWDDPDKFDISRWMPPNALTDTQKLVYSPFGWGPRSCLGMHFAQMEIRLATAAFFQRFPKAKLAPSTTEDSMKPRDFFVISPSAGECKVVLS